MKKLKIVLVAVLLCVFSLAALAVSGCSGDIFEYTSIGENEYEIKVKDKEVENLSGDIVIPSEYKGGKVTRLADYCFGTKWATLNKITIPEGVTSIGMGATWYVHVLTIDLPVSITHIESLGLNVERNGTINYSGTRAQFLAIEKEQSSYTNNVVCSDGDLK